MSKRITLKDLAASLQNEVAMMERKRSGKPVAMLPDNVDKLEQLKDKLDVMSKKFGSSGSSKKAKALTPVSQLKKKKKTMPAAKSSQKAKSKTKSNQMTRTSKKELYADTIENRIEAQREARKGGKVRAFAKKVKSSIYDKVQKQRKERSPEPKKVDKPKDPKKVKSKPVRIGR